ncbi:radical SAM protein [Pseudodesulfovibrio sp.]|uniref:radical SAM protein n=1 Tax=unclassified Pseudodesulfovibrio TaxID=2661612 RepID=UPI003AFFA6E3
MPKVYFTPDEMCTTIKLEMRRVQDFFLVNDWEVTTDPDQADLLLCLTCSGWEKLEHNSIHTLQSLQKYGDKVVSVGCVNNVNPEGIRAVHSGRCIDTHNFEHIESLIDHPRVTMKELSAPSMFRTREDYRLYDLTKRFVNIAMGCSFKCTYCPHRIGLGPLRSRTRKDILNQIEELKQENLRILVLTGMETAYYGTDIGTTFPELLRDVLAMDGHFDIHVAQFHPIGVTKYADELLPLFSNPRVTDIQMPIQSTSPRLLKMMGRPQLSERLGDFLHQVSANNSRVVLRTDLIIGFPTETMEELDASIDFASANYDEAAVYGIEIRKGLPTEKYLDQTFSAEELHRRCAYAASRLEKAGTMAHGGQQSEESLLDLEARKQKIREKKGAC